MNTFTLKLFITGRTARAELAIANLTRVLEQALQEQYELTIIDVLEQPELAELHKVLATPTLVKDVPPPARRIIGDLSDFDKVTAALGLTPLSPHPLR